MSTTVNWFQSLIGRFVTQPSKLGYGGCAFQSLIGRFVTSITSKQTMGVPVSIPYRKVRNGAHGSICGGGKEFQSLIGRFVTTHMYYEGYELSVSIPYRKVRNLKRGEVRKTDQ